METLLTNAYTRLDQKSKLFETNATATGTKELKKSTSKKTIFFTKCHFKKFINRMNGGYEMIWKLSYGN